ncbi:MAG TPA: hypothetical protein VNZ52_02890 [Candidatus Thermoplasmatota archaeon]|nr:hypothetical protein [Candidatus Thermoplasmatota archaeon]
MDSLGLRTDASFVFAVAFGVSLVAALLVTPLAIRKLRGAGIVGKDRQKPGNPEVAEMGGIAVFLAFNAGAFLLLATWTPVGPVQASVLAALVVAAGACITGIIDDLIPLRQRFKAIIPFIFAAPFAMYVSDWTVTFPGLGFVDMGLLYPVVLVPLAIACASNSFNMLEGFNGLAAGMGLVIAAGLSVLAWLKGNLTGLVLLVPLMGALAGFLVFNFYPAKVFPGDTMTLTVGAVLALGAMLSKLEFWCLILFLPYIVEFMVKGLNGFPSKGWWGDYREGRLHCPPNGPVGLAQWVMKVSNGISERGLVCLFMGVELVIGAAAVAAFLWIGRNGGIL